MAIHSPRCKNGGAMQSEADAEMSLFVRDRATGRLVFNSKAIESRLLDLWVFLLTAD